MSFFLLINFIKGCNSVNLSSFYHSSSSTQVCAITDLIKVKYLTFLILKNYHEQIFKCDCCDGIINIQWCLHQMSIFSVMTDSKEKISEEKHFRFLEECNNKPGEWTLLLSLTWIANNPQLAWSYSCCVYLPKDLYLKKRIHKQSINLEYYYIVLVFSKNTTCNHLFTSLYLKSWQFFHICSGM